LGFAKGQGMSALDHLLPVARLVEVDQVDVAAPPLKVWEEVRHGDLGRSPLIRGLFSARAIPGRLAGQPKRPSLIRIDDLHSTAEEPGFQVLVDEPPREVVVGAIGQVWQGDIPFLHLSDSDAYRAFSEAGWVKVAWSIRVLPRGTQDSKVELEVRVDATDEASWQRFRRYFRLIGPGSHFIRKSALRALAHTFGDPDALEEERPLFGDERLPDSEGQLTQGITIAATPDKIWPWLLQLGCRRGGYYSYDVLDNAGVRSARQLHPELMGLEVGQVLPATPEGHDGFEVLAIEPERALLLGGLWDVAGDRQLPFAAKRPEKFWQVTWSFVLEPLDSGHTRLHARARAAYSSSEKLHVAWIRPVHAFMQSAQLQNLKARAEARLPADDWRDVLEGLGGAALMTLALLSPFRRQARTHWGLRAEDAARSYPGDDVIVDPRWGWTHAVEIGAPAEVVWPWIAQIGADRGGFYSYQWLENLAGCELKNAEVIHPEWEVKLGQTFVLHPSAPPLVVSALERGRYYVVSGAPDPDAVAAHRPWAAVSWLFMLEPLGPDRCRFISRFRTACTDDLLTRLSAGPTLLEPVGFTMDRRMLLGVKDRAEKPA